MYVKLIALLYVVYLRNFQNKSIRNETWEFVRKFGLKRQVHQVTFNELIVVLVKILLRSLKAILGRMNNVFLCVNILFQSQMSKTQIV